MKQIGSATLELLVLLILIVLAYDVGMDHWDDYEQRRAAFTSTK
jgi:hypothetical protein